MQAAAELVGRFEERRKSVGMTAVELCRRAGISEVTYFNLIGGRVAKPRYETVRAFDGVLKSAECARLAEGDDAPASKAVA
jgi:predicted transcriptional regulator